MSIKMKFQMEKIRDIDRVKEWHHYSFPGGRLSISSSDAYTGGTDNLVVFIIKTGYHYRLVTLPKNLDSSAGFDKSSGLIDRLFRRKRHMEFKDIFDIIKGRYNEKKSE